MSAVAGSTPTGEMLLAMHPVLRFPHPATASATTPNYVAPRSLFSTPFPWEVLGVVVAAGILILFGALDDRFDLDYRVKFLGQLLAVTIVIIYGGVRIGTAEIQWGQDGPIEHHGYRRCLRRQCFRPPAS